MFNWLKRNFDKLRKHPFWSDAVISKVIAQGIIVLIGATATFIYLKFNDISLVDFLNQGVKVYWILSFIVLRYIYLWLSSRKSKSDRLREEVSKMNKIITDNGSLCWKYDVLFDDLRVMVSNLKIYCNKHDHPLLMVNSSSEIFCPVCRQSIPNDHIAIQSAENMILSNLQHEVELARERYGIQ